MGSCNKKIVFWMFNLKYNIFILEYDFFYIFYVLNCIIWNIKICPVFCNLEINFLYFKL